MLVYFVEAPDFCGDCHLAMAASLGAACYGALWWPGLSGVPDQRGTSGPHCITPLWPHFSFFARQIGGEIVDLIVVLRSVEALKAFCGDYHLAVGASLGAAAGPVGRILEADVRAGRQGLATAYTYSCAKGKL